MWCVAALGSTIMSIALVISRKETQEKLLPLFSQLLEDPQSDVRLNIISKLDSVRDVRVVYLFMYFCVVYICSTLPYASGVCFFGVVCSDQCFVVCVCGGCLVYVPRITGKGTRVSIFAPVCMVYGYR